MENGFTSNDMMILKLTNLIGFVISFLFYNYILLHMCYTTSRSIHKQHQKNGSVGERMFVWEKLRSVELWLRE